VKGSDNKFHVAYELSIFNDSPRPATITKLETLASDHNGEVISTMSREEITALALLTASYPAPAPISEIPAGRTLILPLDDVYDTRRAVPASVTHRITATFGPVGPDLGELANIYPEKVVEIGGSVTTSHDKPVVIGAPVTGDGWVASNGLGARKLNFHRGAVVPVGGRLSGTERFAVDWARVDPSAKPLTAFKGDPTKNESYLSFDQPLVAVADGTVVSVVSDQPNVPPGALSRIPFAQLTGNRIIVDIGNGVFALYGHVKNNGVAVKIGEKVKKGQVIGRLGNSGNTFEPHLHFQLMRGPLPLSFDNVPWEIDHFTLIGSATVDGVVSDPAAGPRTNELPLANTVSNFVTPGR
jgi:Peptidase family M23